MAIEAYNQNQARAVTGLAFLQERSKLLGQFAQMTHMWRQYPDVWEGTVTFPIKDLQRGIERAQLSYKLDLIEQNDPYEAQSFDTDWKRLIGGQIEPYKGETGLCPEQHPLKPVFREKNKGVLYERCTICTPPFVRWPKPL